jgi:isopentenyldiphosphate isomerase
MEEHVDILDSEGQYTGKSALKSEAHRNGWFHPTVHIWFYSGNGKVLIQQRGRHKQTHPLLWDVSVAGHVEAGESIPAAAIREIKEEIGLDIPEDELEKIGVFRSEFYHRETLVDREFHHIFICKLPRLPYRFKKQSSEVESLEMIPLILFAEEVIGLARPARYVPHDTSYYQEVIRAIKAKL